MLAKWKLVWMVPGFLLVSQNAFAEATGHSDPIAPALLALFVVLLAAKLGGELFERLSLPAVLGELIAGIVLGNLVLVNHAWSFLEPLRATPIRENWALIIDSLARFGVIILLFEVGLESTVKGMMKVGKSALLVAVLGVIAPFLLGFAVSWIFVKSSPCACGSSTGIQPKLRSSIHGCSSMRDKRGNHRESIQRSRQAPDKRGSNHIGGGGYR